MRNLKVSSFIIFLLFFSLFSKAQTLSTVNDLTANDFVLSNVTDIFDEQGNLIGHEAEYVCFWRYFRRKKCRRRGGICAKGRTKYDLEGNILNMDYTDPTDNTTIQNVSAIKSVENDGIESLDFVEN